MFLDEHNFKAYLLCSQSKAHLVAKGSISLIDDALRYCEQGKQKCKDMKLKIGVEKAKLLQVKLRVQKEMLSAWRATELHTVLKYYTALIAQEQMNVSCNEVLRWVQDDEVEDVPDYFICQISLVTPM